MATRGRFKPSENALFGLLDKIKHKLGAAFLQNAGLYQESISHIRYQDSSLFYYARG
jgi:hypothetical protein